MIYFTAILPAVTRGGATKIEKEEIRLLRIEIAHPGARSVLGIFEPTVSLTADLPPKTRWRPWKRVIFAGDVLFQGRVYVLRKQFIFKAN